MRTGTPLEGFAKLSRAVGGMLASLLKPGKLFPFHLVALAQNGACMEGWVVQGEEIGVNPVWDVEDVPDDELQLPIHIVWLDSGGGDAVHVQLDKSGTTRFLN
jgi:hypothetical protein